MTTSPEGYNPQETQTDDRLPRERLRAVSVRRIVVEWLVAGAVVLVARLQGAIAVPGYAAIVLAVVFFAALNTLGLGIIGTYVWRAFENTKRRPQAIVMSRAEFPREGS